MKSDFDFAGWLARHDLSQAEAARRLGMGRNTVAYYADGRWAVPKSVALACLALDHGLDSALSGDYAKEPPKERN